MRARDIEIKLEQLAADEEGSNALLAIAQLIASDEGVHFYQSEILQEHELMPYDKLKSLHRKYNGLCEVISNYVISEDLLGLSDSAIQSSLEQMVVATTANKFKQKIKLSFLNAFSETHILDKATFSAFSLAYFFDSYPLSLFTASEMREINSKGNTELLIEGLKSIRLYLA